jgi:hypothetical protein
MKKPLRSSARGACFHTKHASNVNVVRVVLLDANLYLALRLSRTIGYGHGFFKLCKEPAPTTPQLVVQSTAHPAIHFGLCTALIPKELELIEQQVYSVTCS